MAIVENSSLGKIKGNIGGGLFAYERMGKTILRKSRGERKKSSEKQEGVMSAFTLVSRLYSYAKSQIVLPVWKLAGAGYGKMAHTYFAHVNKGIFNKKGEIRDYEKLILSDGVLLNPDGMTVEPAGNGVFTVIWTGEDECRTRAGTDKLMVLILPVWSMEDFRFGILWAENVTGQRDQGAGIFTLPAIRGECHIHAYCFFGAADGTAYSRSKHFLLG